MKRLLFTVLLCMVLTSVLCAPASAAEIHYMGNWHYYAEYGQHWAECVLCEGFCMLRDCSSFSCEYDGTSFRVCPVCGHCEGTEGAIVRSRAFVYDYANSPTGDLLVMRYDRPFGENSDILAAYSVIFEYAGEIVSFDGTISLSVPVEAGSYGVYRADGGEISLIESEFDSDAGFLHFAVTDGCGLFLLKQP